jgi:hypothetical protein
MSCREGAAVVALAHGGDVGHGDCGTMLRRRISIAVDPHLARRGVDQPLDQVVASGPAGAAVGVNRHGVRQHAETFA